MRIMVSSKRLRQLVCYNPTTGVFVRLISLSNRSTTGTPIGTVNSRGYVVIGIDGRTYLAHRLAWLYMTGSFPVRNIDHIDRNPANNKWHNLREVSQSKNLMNAAGWPRTSSGSRGVWFMEKTSKWTAYITKDRQRHHLGSFDKYDDAVAARRAAEIDMFEETAP